MPCREFKTVGEFRAACQGIETILIDATGVHTAVLLMMKNSVICTVEKKTAYCKEHHCVDFKQMDIVCWKHFFRSSS